MEKEKDFHFLSADGVHQCYAKFWYPDKSPKAVVQIVHGVADYIERYSGFARYLNQHGYLVVGEDHLGHGKSVQKGKLGYFGPKDGWFIASANVRRLRVLVGKENPDLPYFLMGHSMGSFLARTYLIDWPGTLSGAILSGTGQEPASTVAAARAACEIYCALNGADSHSEKIYDLALGAYNKQFSPSRTSVDWISRDSAAVDAYAADPLCTFQPTVGLFRDLMTGLQYIVKPSNLRKMDPATPIYFFSGDQDPVGQNGTGVKWVCDRFKKAGCRDLTLRLYPGGRHEMLNESNKDEVWADTLAWLEGKL